MKELCLIIPTCDRADAVEAYLAAQARNAGILGIDICIQDGSKNCMTLEIVQRWQDKNVCTIRYMPYADPGKPTIDAKVREAAAALCGEYEYLFFSSDGTILALDKLIYRVKAYMQAGAQLIVHGHKKINNSDDVIFSDCARMLHDCAWCMTSLSSTIVRSDLMARCLQYSKINGDEPDDLWLPMVYFRVLASEPEMRGVYLHIRDGMRVNPYISESFWRVQGLVLWQWGERWCAVIDSLPARYNAVKPEVLLSHDRYCGVFSPLSIIGLRAYGNFNLSDIAKYERYIPRVTKTPVWFFKLAAVLVRPGMAGMLKTLYKKMKGLRG